MSATEYAGRSLAIHLPGSFAARVDGRLVPEDAWRGQKSRGLVKLLALAPGARIARDRALDILWPDFAPEAAARNLYSTLTTVRKALAPAADVVLRAGMLTLVPNGTLLIDTDTFVAAVSVARGADAPESYDAALALYTGDLLLDDRYEDWVVARREVLRATYLDLLRGLAACHGARGDHQAAIAALARLVALDRNCAAALRQYDTLRETLEREQDAEPGAATRRLYGDIATGRFPLAAEFRRALGLRPCARPARSSPHSVAAAPSRTVYPR